MRARGSDTRAFSVDVVPPEASGPTCGPTSKAKWDHENVNKINCVPTYPLWSHLNLVQLCEERKMGGPMYLYG